MRFVLLALHYLFGTNIPENGILINGDFLNYLRYADDTAIFAESMEGSQQLINKVVEESTNYRLDLTMDHCSKSCKVLGRRIL